MASIAQVRTRAATLTKPLRDRPREAALLGLKLGASDEQLAFEVFRAIPRAALTLSPTEIETLLPRLHDWNSTDCFASFVSGVAWREGVLSDVTIAGWTRSDNRWIRRAALVSTVPLNLKARGAKAPHGEAAKTLAVCERLLDDRDDMVVKALSWALRTLGARDEDALQRFLRRHDARLAARVKRETKSKLTTGLKNPTKHLSNKSPSRSKTRTARS